MNKQAKLLLNKFLSFSVGSWVGLLIALITTPIITRFLSPEEFGIFSLFIVVLNLFLLISLFGIDQSYVRFYYELNEVERIQVLRKGITFAIIVSVIGAVILFFLGEKSTELIFGTDEVIIMIYFVLGVLVSIINRYVVLLIRMEQQANLFSTLQIVQKTIDFLFLITIFSVTFIELPNHHIPIISYISAMLVITIIGIVKNSLIWKRVFFLKKGEPKSEAVSSFTLFKYGAPLGVTLLLTWTFQYIDRIMLKELSSFEELGIYAAAFKLIAILSIVQVSFTNFWVPLSNQKFNDDPKNKEFFSKIYNVLFIVMLCLGFVMIFIKDLFKIFFGPEFEEAVNLIPTLLLVPIMYTLSEITVVGINFMKRPQYHILISVIVCIINVIGNFLLIPEFGAKGASISTGLSYVVFFIMRSYMGMKFYSFKIFNIYKIMVLSLFIIIAIVFTI